MIINAGTKISELLKADPQALEAIVSISPRFEKLRNPLLRKLMAGRTSIAQASKIGGCTVDAFFSRLEPLGFSADKKAGPEHAPKNPAVPAFIKNLPSEKMIELDVRPVIAAGSDPLRIIQETIKTLNTGMALKLINTFEPFPLITLLQKQGYASAVDIVGDDMVITYFFKEQEMPQEAVGLEGKREGWDEVYEHFERKMESIDVRAMEMPLPMLTILDALDRLAPDTALHVYHKRIPVFLLPELADRKFDYRIKEIGESEVRLLIFKP